jgi:hypothetical protein
MSGTFEDVQDADQGFLEGVFGVSFFMFISVVTALIMLIFIREYYIRKYQVDMCPMLNLCPRRDRQEQRDRALAEELQRQLDLEQQEPDLEAKRKDRREWYESFIRSYTMVSQ